MNPLSLPRGSVRAAIALVLAVGMIPVAIFADAGALAAFAGLAGFVLRDYFAHREDENRREGPVLGEPAYGGDDD